MDVSDQIYQSMEYLVESRMITTSQANLRIKMDSLIRSIQNLEAKKARLDYELKKQKTSLARKRMELKKDSKPVKAKLESAISAGVLVESYDTSGDLWVGFDNYLLRESAETLDH